MFGKTEYGEKGRELMRQIDTDDVLEALGLQRKTIGTSWMWPAIGGIGIGILAGVAIGLAFAPKRGSELRHDVAEKLRRRDIEGLGREAREMIGSTPGTAGRGNVVI